MSKMENNLSLTFYECKPKGVVMSGGKIRRMVLYDYERFMTLQRTIASVLSVSSPDYGEIKNNGTLVLTYNGGQN